MQLYRTILLVWLLGCPWSRRVGLCANPHGMREVTVDDLVARALADNLDLQATQAEVDAAHGRLQQAGLRPNPMLDLGVQKNVAGPDNNLTASVTLPLDLNGRKAGRVGMAAGELEMKRAQVAERARRLRAEADEGWRVPGRAAQSPLCRGTVSGEPRCPGPPPHTCQPGAAPPLEENLLRVEVNRLEASRRLASQVEVLPCS